MSRLLTVKYETFSGETVSKTALFAFQDKETMTFVNMDSGKLFRIDKLRIKNVSKYNVDNSVALV